MALNREASGIRRTVVYSGISILIMGVLILLVYWTAVPNPNMILITALVFSTTVLGMIPGACSAFMMLLYSAYFFSKDHSMTVFDSAGSQKVLVVFLGVVLCYACTAILRSRGELYERQLERANRDLTERAENAERIAALRQSISSLMINMPALSFSKDAETGKYLACNRKFAEYAGKKTPEEVIGHTDYELFDRMTADHFRTDDQKALTMDQPQIFLEEVPDADGNRMSLQTTKMRFVDETGRQCVLGMSADVTELRQARAAYEEAKNEILTYEHIARALSVDYMHVYYADLSADRFREYILDPARNELMQVKEEEHFISYIRTLAGQILYEPDREPFLQIFTRENILKDLREKQTFEVTYRQNTEDGVRYMNLKATRMSDDNDRIVVGIRDVDALMKRQEEAERARQEHLTYSRITALVGDYLVIYTVDPKTDDFTQYMAAEDYESTQTEKSGTDFFGLSRKNAVSAVYEEDLERFLSRFDKETVLKEIEENGTFSIRYRLILNGRPNYVRLRAVKTEEDDGVKLIVGVSDIDRIVRREAEYESDLAAARYQANRDALTGIRNKHAYDEELQKLNRMIENGEHPEFAIVMFDVNDLKLVNDRQGHQAGDGYLRKACSVICGIFKHSPVFRIGGDEFAVIASGQDYANRRILLEMACNENYRNSITGDAMLSGGIAVYDGQGKAEEVFAEADRKMYEKKRNIKENGISAEKTIDTHEEQR